MRPTFAIFLDAIALTEVAPLHGDEAYTATTQYVPWPKAYGGDLVAQAAASATRSVGTERVLHSMHSYFMRPADIDAPVQYDVERLRDGRSYSTREVRATQGGKVIFIALAYFQVPENGSEFAQRMPDGIPEPEDLPSSAESVAGVDTAAARYWSTGRSFDMRHVPGPVYFEVEGASERRIKRYGSSRSTRCRMTCSCTNSPWRTSATTLSWSRSYSTRAMRGQTKTSSPPAWTTRCGSIVMAGWTSGCSTRRRRSRNSTAAAWPTATSLAVMACSWRVSRKKA